MLLAVHSCACIHVQLFVSHLHRYHTGTSELELVVLSSFVKMQVSTFKIKTKYGQDGLTEMMAGPSYVPVGRRLKTTLGLSLHRTRHRW